MKRKKKNNGGHPAAIQPANEMTSLLAPREVQQLLGGICRHSLRRWEIAGRIKAIRLGRRVVRFRKVEIERLIREGE